jgi:hypothetical protein
VKAQQGCALLEAAPGRNCIVDVQLPIATLEVASPYARLGFDIAARDSPFDHAVLRKRQDILPWVVGNHKEHVTEFAMAALRTV